MKGEARIRVGSRTLIEYAFEPIRQLREEYGIDEPRLTSLKVEDCERRTRG